MTDKLKPKRNWMNGFVFAPRTSEAERLDNERARLLANRKVNDKRGGG